MGDRKPDGKRYGKIKREKVERERERDRERLP